MATHSSIVAWRIPMDRGAWWAAVHGVPRVGHVSSNSAGMQHKWCSAVTRRAGGQERSLLLGYLVLKLGPQLAGCFFWQDSPPRCPIQEPQSLLSPTLAHLIDREDLSGPLCLPFQAITKDPQAQVAHGDQENSADLLSGHSGQACLIVYVCVGARGISCEK